MDGRELAQHAYYSLLEETAKAQQELLQLQELKLAFGLKAIPPASMLRTLTTLRDSPQTFSRWTALLMEKLDKNYETLEEMERIFAEHQDADIKAFAKYMRDRKDKDA